MYISVIKNVSILIEAFYEQLEEMSSFSLLVGYCYSLRI